MGLLGGLDLLPVRLHRGGVLGGHVTEDVGVSPHQLGHQVPGDVVDVERLRPVLLGDPGVEQDLEQHVAELLDHVVPVPRLQRLDRLVRLLHQVGHERGVRLLGVPGAPAR